MTIADPYLVTEIAVARLVKEYHKHKNLVIGFDFDNTVFDYHEEGHVYPLIERLLVFLKQNEFKLVLFTGNQGDRLQFAINYCEKRGYKPDYVNESPLTEPGLIKPMLSILLDDRCGLHEAFVILLTTLKVCGFDTNLITEEV